MKKFGKPSLKGFLQGCCNYCFQTINLGLPAMRVLNSVYDRFNPPGPTGIGDLPLIGYFVYDNNDPDWDEDKPPRIVFQ
jgi:hypothetical protein